MIPEIESRWCLITDPSFEVVVEAISTTTMDEGGPTEYTSMEVDYRTIDSESTVDTPLEEFLQKFTHISDPVGKLFDVSFTMTCYQTIRADDEESALEEAEKDFSSNGIDNWAWNKGDMYVKES